MEAGDLPAAGGAGGDAAAGGAAARQRAARGGGELGIKHAGVAVVLAGTQLQGGQVLVAAQREALFRAARAAVAQHVAVRQRGLDAVHALAGAQHQAVHHGIGRQHAHVVERIAVRAAPGVAELDAGGGVAGVGAAVDLEDDGDGGGRAAQFVGDLGDETAFALVTKGDTDVGNELAAKGGERHRPEDGGQRTEDRPATSN
jgi:hypothetical protein